MSVFVYSWSRMWENDFTLIILDGWYFTILLIWLLNKKVETLWISVYQLQPVSYWLFTHVKSSRFPTASLHFTVHFHTFKLSIIQYHPLSKSKPSRSLGFETELSRHVPVGSKRCQSVLALLLLKCHCLKQIEVNQICVRGVLLRALSLYSWQQWAHWWIAVLYVKPCVYVFKARDREEGRPW